MPNTKSEYTDFIRMDGQSFEVCLQLIMNSFNVSIPFINGAGFKLEYNNSEGKPIITQFIYGYHFQDYLTEEIKVTFQVSDMDCIMEIFQKHGIEANIYIVIMLVEYLYISSQKEAEHTINPINVDDLDKLGINLDNITPDNFHLFMAEKKSDFDKELNENQKQFLQEANDEYDYVDFARQEMLELFIFVNDWKESAEQPLTLKSGYKTIKINNKGGWTYKALNNYFNEHLGIETVEEAKDDLAFNYSKKTGRKTNNKFQTLMIYGIDNLYRATTKSEEITNQQCELIRDYLKHLGLSISQDSFDDPDDIKNIRSRIRYLRKNGCAETWGLPPSHLETIQKLYTAKAGRN